MKKLITYISEALRVTAHTYTYKYRPECKAELHAIIKQLIRERGKDADLNDIDTQDITDMSYLFYDRQLRDANPVISRWNVSNVTDMSSMFAESSFTGDISQWDVSGVTNMHHMFFLSSFNGDISQWDVSHVTNMGSMFMNSDFNGDISEWDVSGVTNMSTMFCRSAFNGDVSQWNVRSDCSTACMFTRCPAEKKMAKWLRSIKN